MTAHQPNHVTSHTNGVPSDRFPVIDAPYDPEEVGNFLSLYDHIEVVTRKGRDIIRRVTGSIWALNALLVVVAIAAIILG